MLRFVPTLLVFLICSLNTALANEVSGEARVRDADTIVVSGTPVRLNGIDAPENPTRAGMEATQSTALINCLGKILLSKMHGGPHEYIF